MSVHLRAFGRYLPARVVSNAELAQRLGRTPEWIEQASGIRERRWAGAAETVASMGVRAAADCLARAGLAASELGLLIAASGSGARGFPGPAAEIAHGLGLAPAPALDVPIASAGSLFALALARELAPRYGPVLVVASEKMSALLDDNPNTAILFGDGAGAALLVPGDGPLRLADAVLHSDGQFRGDLFYDGALHMHGLNVIVHASRKLPAAIAELLARNSLSAPQVAAFLLHQANRNLLTRLAAALQVDPQRVFTNIERYGNTSSASLLIAAAEWAEQNPAAPVVFAGFGAGFHWGAVLAL
jgi:3-oxoacyl-[acyl-carrier-protein] synthase-3